MRHLIITADDCGLSEGINNATMELYQAGYITAASVMTNFPAYHHAFDVFREHPNLEIGAHLTLSDGRPVTNLPSPSPLTTANGDFRHKLNIYSRLLLPSDEAVKWIRHELDAQLNRFIAEKIQPQHITTHRHFHTIPALRKIVYDLAQHYQVQWVRAHEFRATIAPFNLLPRAQQLADEMPFQIPAYISPLKRWLGRDASDYAKRLSEVDDALEIVVHPSIPDDTTFPNVDYSPAQRHQELNFLVTMVDALRQYQSQAVGTA